MLEPQSTGLFILLMVIFCALLVWVAVARHPVFRVLAAALAFVPAMLFGVAAVNKYYDYYQTWSAVAADLGTQGVSSAQITGSTSGQLKKILRKISAGKQVAAQGETLRVTVKGQRSHLSRPVYIYLPPQYFQSSYQKYHFPVIELISGYPGQPQDWINVVGVTQTFQTMLHAGVAKPAVLVMPDPNGGPRISLQCLNVVHGPQDATFLAVDLPAALAHSFRLRPSGEGWGIAGYSEGGFCAANLALNYPRNYGYAGVLSGYFRPSNDRLGNPPKVVQPFGSNALLRAKNTPIERIRALPFSVSIPKFWLGAGSYPHRDLAAASAFQQLLLLRQPGVQLHVASGGGHNMATWRALAPPLLQWMTPRIAQAARLVPAGLPSVEPSPTSGAKASRTSFSRPSLSG